MSNLVVPDQAELTLQTLWLSVAAAGIKIGLFKSNTTPGPTDVYATYTKATFAGYADVTVAFSAPTTISGKGTLVATAPAPFVRSSTGTTETIYGYYVWITGSPGSELILWAERFDTPQPITNAGDEIDVTAVFTLFSQF